MDLSVEELILKYEDHDLHASTVIEMLEEYGEMKWKQGCKAQRESCEENIQNLIWDDDDMDSWPEKVGRTKLVEYEDEPEYE